MFICSMVLQCAGSLQPSSSLHGPVTADLTTTTVVHYSYKLLINYVNPVRSLTVRAAVHKKGSKFPYYSNRKIVRTDYQTQL